MRPRMRQRTGILLLALFSLCFLVACSHIEDTNGDDPALVTISREKLAGKSISHTSSGVSTFSRRNNITLVNRHEDIDLDYLEMQDGKISGIMNIMATEVKDGQTLSIACETAVSSGNLGVILLSPDGEIVYDFAVGAYDEVTVVAEKTGIYLVRIGTESFNGNIIVAREIGR